jgi:hypothetical protein
MSLQSVLKISNPDTGETMAFRWVADNLGGKNPFELDLTSSIAEGSGLLLSVFMPTCANTRVPVNRNNIVI